MPFIEPSPIIGNQDSTQVVEQLRQNLDFLVSSQLQQKVFGVKLAFIAVSVLLIISVLLFLKKDKYDYFKTVFSTEIQERRSYKNAGLKQAQKQWQKIRARFSKEGEAHYKLALIEAEDFLDNVLVRLGLGGDSLEERINRADVSNKSELLLAHQVCQNIIRDPDYTITRNQAFEKFSVFEKSLMFFDAL